MRILTVSAHYPPNFTSGGTLQPQRLARALAERGHQSSVYAGWLGDRPALESWDDVDETGLAVHWIATTPWTGWDDERNWHNPAVADDFRRHLAALQPDVVHLHSLQTLGADLVPAARAAGCRVVVTMHDFWWVCARQFLVDTDMHPCSLVVEAGVCACQVDEPWRRHRAAALAARLASADLVLAPSTSAVAVLAANGVAPDRLAVDENGLPADLVEALGHRPPAAAMPPEARAGAPTGAAVRFLYAGGPDPMKGAEVVVAAAAELGRRAPSGWRLSAYGLDPDASAAGLAGLPVEVLEPFDPDQLGAVLAAHDVLVLASVMRETHSLLTREALAAGLAVVTTDTLGPEEVVTDGVNGLVVAAGRADALAAALAGLVEDPDLTARLRQGAARPLAARSLDDQVDGLAAAYAALLDPTPLDSPDSPIVLAPTPRPDRVRSVVFATGIDGAPLRYRVRLAAEALADRGVTSRVWPYRHPELLADALRADVVVLYRVPATVDVLELIETCHGAGIPVVFDVDDLIFDPTVAPDIPALRLLPPDEAALWLEGVQRYRTTLEACDAFIGSTDVLVERAAALTGLAAHRFDNGVGLELARAADRATRRPRRPGPVRLGYLSGTTTHDDDWRFVEPAVAAVLDRHPDVELWLGGHLPASPDLARFGPRVVRIPFRPWLELPDLLRDLDVNLAPLEPGGAFNQAKSAIKWLEAALCATPTVASPTEPFRQAISDGTDGLLAETPAEWADALERLVSDQALRVGLGNRARRRALLEWSPARQGVRYQAILEAVAAAGPIGPRPSDWTPVVNDEPPEVVDLEPYGAGEPTVGRAPGWARPPGDAWQRMATTGRRIEDLGRRGVAGVRRDGVIPTAHKGLDKLRARLAR